MNRIKTMALAFVLAGLGASALQAQESVLAELYGQGVHAYFAGDFAASHGLLSSTIAQGSRDPRAYLFRGLCYARLGRPDEAAADFKKGAELEATNSERIYPVSESLQRIQGRERVAVERYRQMARLAVRVKMNQIEQARYEQLQGAEKDVLRNPSAKPATAPPAEAIPSPPVVADKNDPFAEGNQVAPEKSPEKPATVATPAAPADPFGTPPAPAAAAPASPPAADPFGGPATPATPMPKDDSTSDPFSDDKPADAPAGNPPAGNPPGTPAENPDPFGA